MATPNVMKDVSVETVLTVLNSTDTITDAAKRLKTSRQTLNSFIKANNIQRQCKYVVTTTTLTTSAQGDA